jgi:hypothetical protein
MGREPLLVNRCQARELIGSAQSVCSGRVLRAIVAGMDARRDDLIRTIVQAVMDPVTRPRSDAGRRGTKAMTKTCSRPAAAIVDALQATGYRISRAPASSIIRYRRGPLASPSSGLECRQM